MRILFLEVTAIFWLSVSLLLSGAVSAEAAGGDLGWQYDVAAINKQEARASAVDSQGCLVITGFSEDGSSDFLTVKLSADGASTLWSKIHDHAGGGDVATAVVIDSNDDVIVTGYVWSGSNYDIHTVKYAGADGSILWQNTYDGAASGHDYATSVAVDAINNVYVGGYMQDGTAKDDFVLLKYGPDGPNPDGTPIWVTSYGGAAGGHDRITAIAAGAGGLAATGESQNVTPDFDLVVVKFGLDGSLLWEKRYADAGDGKGQDVALDSAGNVIVTGYIFNGTDRDIYTVRYPASDGPADWVQTYDGGFGEEGHALWVDENDDVTITGHVFALDSDYDVYTARYAGGTGVESWSRTFNSNNGNSDAGLDLRVKPGGDVYVVATANDDVTGFDDYLVLKYGRDSGTLFWSMTYDGAAKADRPVGLGFAPTGEVLVGGWSDRWTAGATDYDYLGISVDPGLLNTPSDLTAQTVSNTEVGLSWTDNAGNEDGYAIERKIGTFGTYSQLAITAADVTSYSDTGLAPDVRYYYRVRATHATLGHSPYSNETSARTTVISYDPPVKLYQFNSADDGDDFPQAIAVGPDDNPVVTGYSFALVGAFDYFTAKLDRSDATEQWKARYNDGDNESDFATSVAVDGDNQVLVTGYASLYGGGAGNTNDVYTLGYPAAGPPATWSDQYNGPAGDDDRSSSVAVSVDGANNSAVVGYGRNAAFDDDIYLLKYAPGGTRLWAATPYDGGGEDHPAAVAFDPAGDLFVSGYTFNGTDKDFLVAKYDGATGAMVWGGAPQTYDGAGHGDDYVTAMAVDAAGNLYVTGYSFSAAGNGDFVTIKYDGVTGTPLWEKAFNGLGNSYDSPAALQVDPISEEVVVAGTSFVSAGNHDFQVIRYDSAGNLVWSKQLDRPGSDEAVAAMSVDRSGTVCVAGYTNDGANDDVLAVKYDYTGTIIGATVYNGAANDHDQATAVVANAFGEAFVAGFTTAAGGDTDFLVFEADGEVMQTPHPFSAVQLYTQVDLSWSDNSFNETGFNIERKVGTCDAENSWLPIGTTVADATSYSDTGLSIGSTFCYRVQSFNSSGESSRWAEFEVTTGEPTPPSDLTAAVVTTTDIALNWTDNTTGEDGFTIERCSGAACDFSVSEVLDVPAETTSFIDQTACFGQIYSYRLKAYKTGEWVTDVSNVDAGNATPGPAAPSELAPSWIAEERVDLRWLDHSMDETDFVVERCTGSGCADFSQIGSVISAPDNVLLLRMDEALWDGTIDQVTDSSGAGNHGTAVGAVTTAKGRFERGGLFDGNDYVNTGLTIDQSAISAGATFEAWVYPTSSGAGYHYVVSTDNGGNDWGVMHNGGTWYVETGEAQRSTGVAVDLDQWQHIAAVFDPGTGVRFYKNGVEAFVAFIDTDASSSAFTVGRRGSQSQEFFLGRIDEVAVYDRALSAAQVQVHADHGVARYSDQSVAHSTTYSYRVRAHKAADCGWSTAPTAAVEATTAPPPPSQVAADVLDTSRVLLAWADNTSSETGIIIERCQGAGCSDFAEVTTVAVDSTSYMDDTVCAGNTYIYRLKAVRTATWESQPSAEVTAVVSTPTVPASLAVTGVSEEQIAFKWLYDTTDYTGFRVDRCEGNAATCASDLNYFQIRQFSGAPPGQVLDLGMDEHEWNGTAGEVIDRSGNGNHGTAAGAAKPMSEGRYNHAGDFDGSSAAIVTPLNIDQSGTSSGVTFEAWVFPTANNNNYKYVISTDNGGADWSLYQRYSTWYVMDGSGYVSTGIPADLNAWQHMVVVFDPASGIRVFKNGDQDTWSTSTIYFDSNDANVTLGRRGDYTNANYHFAGRIDEVAVYNRPLAADEILSRFQKSFGFSDSGLTSNTSYFYRIRSYKDALCGWESDYAQIDDTTLAPPAPTEFSAAAVDTTRIDLSWTDNATSETGYRIERCPGTGTDCDEDVEFSLLADLAPDTASHSDLTVCNGNDYTYRVRAEKSDGPIWQTSWATAQASTPAAVMAGSLTLDGISESEVSLSWDDLTMDEDSFVIERCAGSGAACDEDAEFSSVVATIPGTTLGNLMLLRMDEPAWTGAADEVIDASGNGNHGRSYYNANTVAEGYYNRAGTFDGSYDFVLTGLNIDQSADGPGVTFEAWVNPRISDNTYRHVISTENGGWDWSIVNYNNLWYIYTGESIRSTGVSVDLNQWQHVAAVFKPGSGITFYKNGVPQALNAAYIDYDTSDNPVNIGRRANGSYYFAGRIDEVAVYGRPLTAEEIGNHHQWGIQRFAFIDTGLAPATTYTYRLKALKSADCSWQSPAAVAEIATQAPPAPTGLAAAVPSTTEVDLSWTDNSGSETGYRLERCPGSGTACDEDSEFALLAELPADASAYLDDTVCNGQTYTYRVRAEKTDGPLWQTSWNGPVSGTMPPFSDPSALTASWVSEVQIDLAWTDNTSDETGFRIERCSETGCSDFSEVATVGSDTTLYHDDELTPGTSYSYRVRGYKSAFCGWESGYTNVDSATTTLLPPSNLVATTVNTTRIDLAWTDNAATETGTIIERCEGAGCSDFSDIDIAPPGATTYSDPAVAHSTTYNYRIKADNSGLSGSGSGCWTRRVPINFSSFAPNAKFQVVVSHTADMQTDFDDLRFYDTVGRRELSFHIKEKTDGVSATVWVQTGSNDSVYMYYGNPFALPRSEERIESDIYTFEGTEIDPEAWVEIDSANAIGQNNGLQLLDVSAGWNFALLSKQTYDRENGREVYFDLHIPADTAGVNYFMAGWDLNQTSNPNNNQLVHGLYWQDYVFNVYERGASRGTSAGQIYAPQTDYQMKVVLKAAGAQYYIRGGDYADWNLVQETSNYTDSVMRIGIHQNSHQATIREIRVTPGNTSGTGSLGAEETSDCYLFGHTWTSAASNSAEATTDSPAAPSTLTANAVSDMAIELAWSDNTADETGFRIERCAGSGCNSFTEIATVGANVTVYTDTAASPSAIFNYRVRAYKTATYSWLSGYSNASEDRTFPATASGLNATAVNSLMIRLDWTDNGDDEDGYEIEVQVWNREFVLIDIVPPNVTTFTDSEGIEPEGTYRYRVRPFRGADKAPYSNEAEATTPAYQVGDTTCP